MGGIIEGEEGYDPATDTWVKRSGMMPTGRFAPSTSVVNGKIYVIGGSLGYGVAVSTLEQYDPVTDTWTRKANMPTARQGLSAINDSIV